VYFEYGGLLGAVCRMRDEVCDTHMLMTLKVGRRPPHPSQHTWECTDSATVEVGM